MSADPIDTEALRRLADAATEGPWERTGRNGIHTPIGSCVALTHRHDPEQRQDDAEFIAAARTAVPALLDALAAAEHRATRAEAQAEARRVNAVYWRERTGVHEARTAAEKRLRMKATAAATEAEARIKAVRDVLDNLEQQPPDQIGWDAAGLLPVFRRALDG